MDPESSQAAGAAPFPTRASVLAWLEQHGLAHVARYNLEAVAPRVDPALWPQLRAVGARRRLLDLASTEMLERSRDWLPPSRLRELLPPLVWQLLEDERLAAERARGELAQRLQAPAAEARPLHARLCELRARMPASVAPRTARALAELRLVFDAELPGFRLDEAQPVELLRAAGGFVLPSVRLRLAPGAERGECSCGSGPCVHVLAAIDLALAWLQQPASPRFERALAELAQPAWQRTLQALGRALDDGPERGGIELTWRLAVVEDEGVEVTPWLQKLGKKGQRGAATAVTRRRLLQEFGAGLDAVDARLATLLPESSGFASRALLEALVGHPRLALAEAPERSVRIERAALGLVAEERHGAVRVSAGLDGTVLPRPLLERVRKGRPDDVLFLWDWEQGAGRLTLIDVKPELRALLGVLAREGDLFPPESHAALLEALSRWAQRLPVVMPRSVMGEAVPALTLPVLRLTALSDGPVQLELRVRPLADGPSLEPGQGARDVHMRRGEKAVHALRDLRGEEAAVAALITQLPLAEAEPLEARFQFRLASAVAALELLDACAAIDPAPVLEWVGAPLRSFGSRGPQALRVALKQRRDWFGVLGELSVEGERVELARLLDAARRQERYVRVTSHSYVELSEALRQHLERLAEHAHPGRHGLELGGAAAAARAIAALERAGASVDADPAWRQLGERIAIADELTPEVPAELAGELRSYQLDGYRWLARLAAWGAGAVLADDMGLGKTVQTLALLLARRGLGPALVLAPTSVAFNWKEEAARFAPALRLVSYADAGDRGELLAQLGAGDVLVASYGVLVRDAERLARQRFATVVFDEAQAIKNASSQRARAARSLSADFKLALSGTPMENHLGELWSVFAAVLPGLLGSWDAFRDRFATPIEHASDPRAAPALARVLAPFLLRRTKTQVEPELPARTEVRVPVVLSSAEWTLYEDARLAALSELETRASVLREQHRRVEVLAALTRLRLLASHPRLYDARSQLLSSKLARFMELAVELGAEGQRALVFSPFTSHLALVREALESRGIAYVYLDGETPVRERGERVRAFQDGQAPLFLISLKAGGFGLNLTAASNVIHLDPWWNPAVEDQASDRAHRLGQERPVTIYRLVALGTIEEQMLSLHAQKRALVAQVLEGKDEAARISTGELLELLGTRVPSS